MQRVPPGVIPITSQGCPIDPRDPLTSPWASGGNPAAAADTSVQKPTRVVQSGAFFANIARNPLLRIFEYVQRTEPNESWFDPARDPSHPTQFELGTVKPQQGQTLVCMEYEIRPYRFSGINAYDFMPLPDGRLSGSMGYTIRINGSYPADLKYQLDPIPSTVTASSTPPGGNPFNLANQLSADNFAVVRASEYASAAGFGTSLMPQSPRMFGPANRPWAEVLQEEQAMTIYGVVFRQVESPIAFVQTRVSGYLGPTTLVSKLLRELSESLR